MKDYITYAEDVLSGKILAGDLIIKSCQRFLNDLKDDRFEFREDIVEKCFNFIKLIKHFTGEHAGKPFVLQPWQKFIVANIVGFYNKGTDERRFTESYIQISRKNGKSGLAAALCLYFLVADGEGGAQVIMAANSKDQVKLSGWPLCSGYAKSIDPKGKNLKCYRDYITFDKTQSMLKVIASDESKLDGFNASFALLDEYHAAKTTGVKDVIRSSMAMRKNPHLCTITTAGFDKTLPCYSFRSYCVEILHGTKQNESIFAAIYELDEDDDWSDEVNWIKCTPNIDITAQRKFIRSEVLMAKTNPSAENGVKVKTLNMWTDSSEVWIPEHHLLKNSSDIDIKDFRESQCYIGIDLAAVSDLTAISILIVKEDKYYFKTHYYLPQSALTEKAQKEMYKVWKNMELLTITPGNVTDYDYILKDILALRNDLNIAGIYYDQWNSTSFVINCTSEGLPMYPYSQSIGNFNKPTRELERLILSDKIVLDNNEITRFCFRNVILKSDFNNNVKPVKYQDNNKIDGVIAMLMSLAGYMSNEHYSNEIEIII